MSNRKLIYILILVLLTVLYLGSEILRPAKIDWSLNFGKASKTPYGCFVIHQKLPEIVSGISISENAVDLFRALPDLSEKNTGLCIITDHFKPDRPDLNSLLRFVSEGNIAFISAQNFDGLFGDTLNLSSTFRVSETVSASYTLNLQMVNPELPDPKRFSFRNISPYFFKSLDTTRSAILEKDSSGRVTYVKTDFGKGYFLLHANPLVFTNYHLLYSTSEYPSRSLAYLANRSLIWDEYYKPGSTQTAGKSPLRFILGQKALRFAYFLFVFTWVLFVFFVGKRKQRIIPVYEKPGNQSLEFIETVSQLYFSQRDNSDILHKKIAHFSDFVHSTYYLRFQPKDETFRKSFAEKSVISIDEVNHVFDELIRLQDAGNISDLQLVNIIAKIDQFQYQNQRLKL